jgi:hypothetical protein
MRTILTTFAIGIAFATAAFGQGGGSSGGTAPPAAGQTNGATGGGSGTIGAASAPVGHRQPRPTDLPADTKQDEAAAAGTNGEQPIDSRDAKLDRALHSICRGC